MIRSTGVPAARLLSTLLDGLMLPWFAYADDDRLRSGLDAAAALLDDYVGRTRPRLAALG